MRKLVLLIGLCVFHFGNIIGQELQQSYLDSAQIVFRSISANFLHFERGFIEDYSSDSVSWSYNEMTSWNNEFVKRATCKVNKYEYDTIQKKREEFSRRGTLIDSIILSNQELKLIFQQAVTSKQFQLPQTFFPKSKIIPTSKILDISFRKNYPNFETWSFTLPCFLRNGQIAACYYIHHFFKGSGTGGLMLFINNSGRWEEFGEYVAVVF